MSSYCERVEMTARPALTLRTHSPVESLSDVFRRGYEQIMDALAAKHEPPAGAPFCVYYNMDMSNLDIEFGFPVSHPMDGTGEVHGSHTPQGTFATCTHLGPYDQVKSAYNALGEWIAQRGYEPAGIAFEVYLNDPTDTPPEKLETEVYLQIRDRDA